MTFLWTPGEGSEPQAIARLRAAFPRPSQPMGEAWFLGEERRMFAELTGDLDAVSEPILWQALYEIASGTAAFGPLVEWRAWYLYLLGRLIPRAHKGQWDSLLETLITAFVALYPDGAAHEPYPGFRRDVLSTLGRSIMDRDCWPDGSLDASRCLHKRPNDNGYWWWHAVSGDLSASMFFCLKYLDRDEIGPWMRSAMAIPDARWRGQITGWLVGAHSVLTGEHRQPADFCAVEWKDSYLLTGRYDGDHSEGLVASDFLPPGHRQAALDAIEQFVSGPAFLDWLMAISADRQVEMELADLPMRLHTLYGPIAGQAGG